MSARGTALRDLALFLAGLKERRIARFLAIGVVNTIFGYGIYAILYLLTRMPSLSIVVATIIGVLFNFLTTGRIVFGNRRARALLPFALGYGLTLGLNVILLKVLIAFGVGALLAQAMSLPVIVTASYLINSRAVFYQRAAPP